MSNEQPTKNETILAHLVAAGFDLTRRVFRPGEPCTWHDSGHVRVVHDTDGEPDAGANGRWTLFVFTADRARHLRWSAEFGEGTPACVIVEAVKAAVLAKN